MLFLWPPGNRRSSERPGLFCSGPLLADPPPSRMSCCGSWPGVVSVALASSWWSSLSCPKGQALWVWDALLGRVGGMGRCPLLQGDHLGRGQCVGEMGTPLGETPEDWPHACKSVFIAGGHHGAAMSPGLLSLNQPSDEGVAEIKLMI